MPKIYEQENIRLSTEIRKLRRQLDAAQDCLRHYANPKNYTPDGVITDGAAFGWDHPDRGSHARSTLRHVFGEDV